MTPCGEVLEVPQLVKKFPTFSMSTGVKSFDFDSLSKVPYLRTKLAEKTSRS